jgi:CHAT domain-containing protein/Tfp pilus assembly protein PilF
MTILLRLLLVAALMPGAADPRLQQPPAGKPASSDAFRALLTRGIELRRAGRFDEAGREFLEAKALATAAGDRAGVASALINYSSVPAQQADYATALAALDEAQAIAESLHDDDLLASSLSNRGIVSRLMGDYVGALTIYDRALTLARSRGQLDVQGRVLTNVGLVYAIQGHYREAIDAYQRSLALKQQTSDAADVANTINNIGAVYETQGNMDVALEYYQRALALAETMGSDTLTASSALSNIAHVYKWTGRRREALDSFQRILEKQQARGSKTGIATALYNIASIRASDKNDEEALAGYQRSLAIREEIRDQWGIAESLEAIAESCINLGRLDQAREASGRAQAVARSIRSNELLWQPQVLDGEILRQQGDLAGSAVSYRDAIATIEALRTEVAGGSESRQRFLEDRIVAYRGFVGTLLALHQVNDALDVSERAHGRVLAETLQNGNGALLPLSAAERERQRALERDVVSLTARVDALGRQTAAPPALADATERLRQARVAYDHFRDDLDARYPVRRLVRGDAPDSGLAAARDLITDTRTAIAEFVVGDRETHLFVLTRAADGGDVDVHAFTIGVTRETLEEQVNRFQQKLATRSLDFHADARRLYDRLLRPAARVLDGRSKLIVVPDGALWYLPFVALEPAAGTMLLDRAAVSYAPSIAVLHAMRTRRATRLSSGAAPRLLVAADPESDRPELDAARRQASALQQVYGRPRTTVLVGAQAAEPRVRQIAADATVLHFATHGVFDDSDPMYSFLQLTAVPGGDASADGRLEAWEIESLKLEAVVAVLTACDTGRGRVAGGEGVIGLTWAFFAAGTPSTVVSLWKLESVSATALTLAFHQRLRASLVAGRHDVAEDLRAAALSLRRDPRYAHPFYWAGLVAVGDGF